MADENFETEVSEEAKNTIIKAEITAWNNTKFQLKMRWRVQKSLAQFGDISEQLKAIEDELTRCEVAIQTLRDMLNEPS